LGTIPIKLGQVSGPGPGHPRKNGVDSGSRPCSLDLLHLFPYCVQKRTLSKNLNLHLHRLFLPYPYRFFPTYPACNMSLDTIKIVFGLTQGNFPSLRYPQGVAKTFSLILLHPDAKMRTQPNLAAIRVGIEKLTKGVYLFAKSFVL